MEMLTEMKMLAPMLRKGCLTVVASASQAYKTAFAISVLSELALKMSPPLPVAIMSMEMDPECLARRLLCAESGISVYDIMKGRESSFAEFTRAASRIKKSPIFIGSSKSISMGELIEKAQALKADMHIGLLIVDSLRRLRVPALRKHGKVAGRGTLIYAALQSMAKVIEIPIITTAGADAINKQGVPIESCDSWRDADILALLHVDKESQTGEPGKGRKALMAELVIKKNSFGETGTVPLLLDTGTKIFRPA